MIRILIADDQALIRDGLQTIIEMQEDMEVVGVAENGYQACDLTEKLKPDLVLLDIKMPGMDGIESTKWIKKHVPDTVVLILTTFSEEQYIIDGLIGGASGYLVKDLSAEKIISSIRDAIQGQFMLPATIAAKLSARLAYLSGTLQSVINTDRLKSGEIHFTEREKEIILLMVEGKNNHEIAKTLFMSVGTVKNYISIIYQKIGTNDRAKAILLLKKMITD
ncbi:response regulator transcription factor [Fervidibacillus albus]|uniref:Response regulator transcription factor n=1 Tax=Fervidibacillus albus TaxID=2980026 RepID=A0A9E8LSZ2_9BACI|nr:response regulator transcription factor [Fervidibacillus albus]WAA08976.1 response regulator transcription factor [Fervidibacillus albus]